MVQICAPMGGLGVQCLFLVLAVAAGLGGGGQRADANADPLGLPDLLASEPYTSVLVHDLTLASNASAMTETSEGKSSTDTCLHQAVLSSPAQFEAVLAKQ